MFDPESRGLRADRDDTPEAIEDPELLTIRDNRAFVLAYRDRVLVEINQLLVLFNAQEAGRLALLTQQNAAEPRASEDND